VLTAEFERLPTGSPGGNTAQESKAPPVCGLSGLCVLAATPGPLPVGLTQAAQRFGWRVATEPDAASALLRVSTGWFFDLLLLDTAPPAGGLRKLVDAVCGERPWLPVVVLGPATDAAGGHGNPTSSIHPDASLQDVMRHIAPLTCRAARLGLRSACDCETVLHPAHP